MYAYVFHVVFSKIGCLYMYDVQIFLNIRMCYYKFWMNVCTFFKLCITLFWFTFVFVWFFFKFNVYFDWFLEIVSVFICKCRNILIFLIIITKYFIRSVNFRVNICNILKVLYDLYTFSCECMLLLKILHVHMFKNYPIYSEPWRLQTSKFFRT